MPLWFTWLTWPVKITHLSLKWGFPFHLYKAPFACGPCLSPLYSGTALCPSRANTPALLPGPLSLLTLSLVLCPFFLGTNKCPLCWEHGLGVSCATSRPFYICSDLCTSADSMRSLNGSIHSADISKYDRSLLEKMGLSHVILAGLDVTKICNICLERVRMKGMYHHG